MNRPGLTRPTCRPCLLGRAQGFRDAQDPEHPARLRERDSLLAFVVRRDELLRRVELGDAARVEAAVQKWRECVSPVASGRGDRGTAPSIAASEEAARAAGEELRQLVLDPLGAHLGGASRLIVAADDVLHLVPLDALPQGEERVGDGIEITVRSTLSELAWIEAAPRAGGVLLAVGGLDYDASPAASGREPPVAVEAAARESTADRSERAFGPISATAAEVDAIGALHARAFSGAERTEKLVGRAATQAVLGALAPAARFLHLATHGYFAPDSIASMKDPRPVDAKLGLGSFGTLEERVRGLAPMVLCGLALSGANRPPDEIGRREGVITAEELAGLDLSGCELAVLSACDTNVGLRRAGQGVASLQKALHMAGARSVITSLWKVPDEATKDLMLDFYRRLWIEKKLKSVALWEAKMKLRKAKDEAGRPKYTTRDWAAWVLTGDPN